MPIPLLKITSITKKMCVISFLQFIHPAGDGSWVGLFFKQRNILTTLLFFFTQCEPKIYQLDSLVPENKFWLPFGLHFHKFNFRTCHHSPYIVTIHLTLMITFVEVIKSMVTFLYNHSSLGVLLLGWSY